MRASSLLPLFSLSFILVLFSLLPACKIQTNVLYIVIILFNLRSNSFFTCLLLTFLSVSLVFFSTLLLLVLFFPAVFGVFSPLFDLPVTVLQLGFREGLNLPAVSNLCCRPNGVTAAQTLQVNRSGSVELCLVGL